MLHLDPAAVLFSNLIVGLMALALLWLANSATAQVRHGVVLWVVGDAVQSIARGVLLLQPGVLHATGVAALGPSVASVLNGMMVLASAVLHTLGLRAALHERDNPRWLLGLSVAFPAAYLALVALLAGDDLMRQLQLMLPFAIVCSGWSLALGWRHRGAYRGAWLVCAIMLAMLLFAAVSMVGLAFAPKSVAAPSLLPPVGVLLLSLLSAMGMTLAFTLIQFERMQHRIQLVSLTDPLTGVYNRRGFVQLLSERWQEAVRHPTALTLAILDLDHFKRINDTLGHDAGDAVLVGFVERLLRNLRSGDVLGRWGGEEFVVLMPHTTPDLGLLVIDRLRVAVAASPLADGVPVVTVSAGITSFGDGPAETNHAELIARADVRLYRAKQRRNCVVANDEQVDMSVSEAMAV